MQISGPPAFDGAQFGAIAAQIVDGDGVGAVYAGELAMDLVRTNDLDTGSIKSSTFQGGSIEVYGGPWTIAGNTVKGSIRRDVLVGCFCAPLAARRHPLWQSGHAIRPGRARVSPGGHGGLGLRQRDRGKHIRRRRRATGNEWDYSSATGQFYGINDPEVITAESTYGVLFEGRPGAVSADGRLLVLPNVRAWATAGSTGPGLVVSILEQVGQNGAPEPGHAGEWFPVAQQVSLSSANTIELLMEDPLPALPAQGYYVVEVTGGFVE